ncbi:MAG: ADP-ribosylglycohydrolase family protein [Woeseiaceae bacterium]
MSQETKDRILGAFYGQALGDAFGMPSELWSRSRVIQHFGWIDSFLDGPQENDAAKYFKAAEFTDDTSMAIALADSILKCGGRVDSTIIAGRILAWVESFDAFDKNVLGPTSKIALKAIKAGQPVADLPNLGVTNGAAMRIMPMGCLLPTHSFDDFYAEIAASCAPTHKSDVAIAGAVVIAWAISRAVDGQAWSEVVHTLPDVARQAQLKNVNTFSASLGARIELALSVVKEGRDVKDASAQIYDLVGAGTSTIESVPAAVAMADLAGLDPNRCAELCANLGGDTDTIGAMATAICGANSGIGGFDGAFLQQLIDVNNVNFDTYAEEFLEYRSARSLS